MSLLAAAHPAIADEPRPKLHLRAGAETPLKDLAGPHKTEAYLGQQVGSDTADPTRTRLLDQPAWAFDASRDTRIFLGQGAGNELQISGALTVAAVLQVDQAPSGKSAIVSKWQLVDGGRSYELGVGADLCLYFHVSASGKWDRDAAEIQGERPLKIGVPYLVAGVFDPDSRLEVSINGILATENPSPRPVPKALFKAVTPTLVGTRPGSPVAQGFTGKISEVWIFDRALSEGDLKRLTRDAGVTTPVEPLPPVPKPPYDLQSIRNDVREWYAGLQAPGKPYGAYRLSPSVPPDLYASADVAWIRWMMDDLTALSDAQRREWIGFIQDQQQPDGTYRHRTGHIATHAFCHATGALNMLGGPQRYAPKFLDRYRDVAKMDQWLSGIDWQHAWGASHDIWGAGLPLACTPETPQAWRDALFAWLDRQVEPRTGMWRRGVQYPDALEPLGGAFHIWPIYAALGRELLYPERIIDLVLAMQCPDGSFDGGFGYGNMDGVWVLAYLIDRTAYRRDEVRQALLRNLSGLMRAFGRRKLQWLSGAHDTESRVAALAILSTVLPDQFRGAAWRNPWHRRELFVIRVAR
ncbi:MAG: LamG domain-containing protein [Phycisphaerae bacterium]|nr:LamG domain-containing protein [Phycisphaerae bacterium]